MNLPARQQRILDQIEQVLQAADPRLKSAFAAFARRTSGQAMPATEAITTRSARRAVLICVVVASVLGVLTLSLLATKDNCPGLSSDQVVTSAAVRLAGCNTSTDAWSRGAR
ncbi:MAG: DUF3040 domain-containing protein [Streptosporangiales bacterium]